jgi:hypothetical protein
MKLKIFAIILILLILLLLYEKNKIYELTDLKKYNKNLQNIEKKFSKKYPLNDNFFTITHYPNYNTFFNQFESYKYYLCISRNKIIGTCCFGKLKNINCYYVCDLKSLISGKNLTYYFFKRFVLSNIFKFKFYGVFGITMQPNPIIDNLVKKYFFKKYETLNLYEVEYIKLINNIDIFTEYFKDFTYTYGYKILNVYDKNNKFIENKKIIHITRNKENKNINLINSNLMFCVPEKHSFNDKLKLKNIIPINKMCIFGFNCNIKNWEHIETHMI